VFLSGFLPDGAPFSQATILSRERSWPLFATPYLFNRGLISGVVTTAGEETATPAGSLKWFKPAQRNDVLFPVGFAIPDIRLVGSRYVVPPRGSRVLSSFTAAPENSGIVELAAGNLTANITRTISLSAANVFTILPPPANSPNERLELRVNLANGFVTGAFIHPGTLPRRFVPIRAVVLQNAGTVEGQFIGSTFSRTAIQTGTVHVAAGSAQP
jgi:hypothetical protein